MSKKIWIAAYWIYYSWGTCLQSLRSEKRGLKKPRCEMVKDFAVNSGRKINSLELCRRWNLDQVWICCFKESVEQKVIPKAKACLTLGNELNLSFGEDIQKNEKKKKKQEEWIKDMFLQKRQSGKLGKVMVMYECKPTNVTLSAMASVENSRWESLFANSPLMERRSSSYLSEWFPSSSSSTYLECKYWTSRKICQSNEMFLAIMVLQL